VFGLSWAEATVIAVVTLVLLGPEKLPSVIRLIAKFYSFLMKVKADFTKVVEDNLAVMEKEKLAKQLSDLKAVPASIKKEVDDALKACDLATTKDASISAPDLRKDLKLAAEKDQSDSLQP
jgi:sec-independent protein translocase protein TatB